MHQTLEEIMGKDTLINSKNLESWKHVHTVKDERTETELLSYNQARFTKILLKTVRQAPATVVYKLLSKVQLENSKQFHAVIK